MKLFRTVSQAEKDDYDNLGGVFRTAENTLEAKQFFKSEIAVRKFLESARNQEFFPPYEHLFVVDINEKCLRGIGYDEQELDTFEAITIQEDNLTQFNNCINFVDQYAA